MKKILLSLILLSSLSLLVFPLIANAQYNIAPKESCTLKHDITIGNESFKKGDTVDSTVAPNTWGLFCMADAIFNVVDWIFWLLIIMSIVFILIGAILFVTAAGDPGKMGKAKTFIIFGAIGLIIAVFSKAIPSLIIGVLGV